MSAHLNAPEVRLLTLTGPPGVGKTRLALAAAAAVAAGFNDGAVVVDLAPLTEPADVLDAIRRALDLRPVADRPLAAVLRDYLATRHLLLLLDNFEHLLPAGADVAALLTACPGVVGLATSRTALRVPGEREVLVAPLVTPAADAPPDPAVLAAVPAVALFVARARAVAADFALTRDNARVVADLCVRLDGLPLAIELAAARIRLLSPAALRARLDDPLRLLAGGAPDLPPRQRTLREALAWSYALLPDRQQRLFRQLAVFAGGSTVEAVEAIAGAAADPCVDVLSDLTALLDANLLALDRRPEHEPRVRLLETVRAFARERLAASGEADAIGRRHVSWALAFAERTSRWLPTVQASAAWPRVDSELANLRAALRWCVDHDAVALGADLLVALHALWWMHGYLAEARAWVDAFLALPSAAADPRARAALLGLGGQLAGAQGDQPRAHGWLIEAVALARAGDDRRHLGYLLRQLGGLTWPLDAAAGQALLEEAVALFRALGDAHGAAATLNRLGNAVHAQGDLPRARALLTESLALHRARGDRISTVGPLLHLGLIAEDEGDLATARRLFEEGIALVRAEGSGSDLVGALTVLGRVRLHQGDGRHAAALLAESIVMARRLGTRGRLIDAVAVIAELALHRRRPAAAARLLGAGQAHRAELGLPQWPTDGAPIGSTLVAVRDTLGDDACAAELAAGGALSLEATVAMAVEVLGPQPAAGRTRAGSDLSGGGGATAPPDGLTRRELEVLQLVGAGRSNRAIAEALVISTRTVVHHVEHIYRKTGARNRAEAVAYALRRGLADEAPPDR